MFVNFFDFSGESMSFSQELVSDYRVTLSWIFLDSIYKNRKELSFQYDPDVGSKIEITDDDIIKYNQCLSIEKKLSSKRCSTINIDTEKDSMSRRTISFKRGETSPSQCTCGKPYLRGEECQNALKKPQMASLYF